MIRLEVKGHQPAPYTVQLRNAARSPSYNAMKAWQMKVTAAARQTGQYIDGPVTIRADFYLMLPKSWTPWKVNAALMGQIAHTNPPDVDNCCKALIDACKRVILPDDTHVVGLQATKNWVASEAEAGVIATIAPAVGYPAQIATKAELLRQKDAAQ